MYHIHIQLDLLYLLVRSNLENVDFLTFTSWSQCKIYWTCKSKVAAVFFEKLILLDGFSGCEYHIHIQLDLLYLLVGSNLENVELSTFTRILVPMSDKLNLQIQGRSSIFEKNHTFKGFRSCEYHIHIQLDLLYLLVGSNLENVDFLTFTRILVPM